TAAFNRLALKCNRRVFADIKEVGAPQVIIALGNPGIDTGYFDPRRHARTFRRIPVQIDCPGKPVELTARFAQQMSDFKPNVRTVLIECVTVSRMTWSDTSENNDAEGDCMFGSIHNARISCRPTGSRSGGLLWYFSLGRGTNHFPNPSPGSRCHIRNRR